MINYTQRLDNALRISAWAHEQAGQHRKGTDIPYSIHPVGVMMIASNVTEDEDVLIACLLHDVLEDVPAEIYPESQMIEDFGLRAVGFVKDVTKNGAEENWRKRSEAYLIHLEHEASDEAVIVSAADKIHNLQSIVFDYQEVGDTIWQRFTTKSKSDQLWWYESILRVITVRNAPELLVTQLTETLKKIQSA